MTQKGDRIQRGRGVIIRYHPSGLRVCMYYDEPGIYRDERSVQVSSELAEQAGFNIAKWANERAKNQRMLEMRRLVDAEFASMEDKLAAAAARGAPVQVRHVGNNRYAVFDGDERLTPIDMTLSEATSLAATFGGEQSAGNEANESTRAAALSGAVGSAPSGSAAAASGAEGSASPGAAGAARGVPSGEGTAAAGREADASLI